MPFLNFDSLRLNPTVTNPRFKNRGFLGGVGWGVWGGVLYFAQEKIRVTFIHSLFELISITRFHGRRVGAESRKSNMVAEDEL
jgi:hypothetical protein